MISLQELVELSTSYDEAHAILERWLDSRRISTTFPRFLGDITEHEDDYEIMRDQALGHASHLAALAGLCGRDRGLLIALSLVMSSHPFPGRGGYPLFISNPEFATNLGLTKRDRDKLEYVQGWIRARHLGRLHEEDIRDRKRDRWFSLAAAYFLATAASYGKTNPPLEEYWAKQAPARTSSPDSVVRGPFSAVVAWAYFLGSLVGIPVVVAVAFLFYGPRIALICFGCVLMGFGFKGSIDRLARLKH